jgi:hypothetical protein
MSSKIAIACCAAGILVGVGTTWLMTRPGDATGNADRPERVVRDGRGERTSPIRIERAGVDADELRKLVAEEVRAALREHASAPPAGDAAKAAGDEGQEPTPAFEQARRRVTDLVAQGTWTAADRDWIRTALGAVSDGERKELTRQVIVAANSGALHVDLVGPLF